MIFYSAPKQVLFGLIIALRLTSCTAQPDTKLPTRCTAQPDTKLPTRCTTQPDTKLPITARLVAKYQVLDEDLSPNNAKCDNIVEEFLQAGPYACSFKVQDLEFDIEDKYIVDSTGHIQKYYSYLAEGPVIYGPKEFAAEPNLMHSNGLDNFYIALVANLGSIIDSSDTIAIEQVFPAEKLILARRSAHLMRGRRFIYQYQE
ncbi:hypothetical protein IC235_02545 [Hymenobacter sp. BT664]|uniref:Uncharacterized protein n=1 Tax=Hymenobacter montanus TaxID=2771359 RepID=A0A927BB32_9BACT|nr:hypothetical protein [Hymenobacter montanus]MBD2766768.1 hypothetical protein [Hymenobacter montanus]